MKCSNRLLAKRLKAEDEAQISTKAAAWAKIKQEAPLLADLMSEIGQAFGKPKAVRVELKNELILHVGEFDTPKNFFNGKLTRKAQK